MRVHCERRLNSLDDEGEGGPSDIADRVVARSDEKQSIHILCDDTALFGK